jgi:hypothetical protein
MRTIAVPPSGTVRTGSFVAGLEQTVLFRTVSQAAVTVVTSSRRRITTPYRIPFLQSDSETHVTAVTLIV